MQLFKTTLRMFNVMITLLDVYVHCFNKHKPVQAVLRNIYRMKVTIYGSTNLAG